jgi:RecA-family ATPase
MDYLREWNASCSPPWSQKELDHAWTRVEHQQPNCNVGYLRGGTPLEGVPSSPAAKPETWKLTVAVDDIDCPPVPRPIPDGARRLIRALFQEGEYVSLSREEAVLDEFGEPAWTESGKLKTRCGPSLTMSREWWLNNLDRVDGDPNQIYSDEYRNGAYIRLNPMLEGGSKDADVTAFRHTLVEFDRHSIPEQWRILHGAGLPIAALIHSGGRSLHAWVRVDAKDRLEYEERVAELHSALAEYGIDTACKNPSRLSRLPGMIRGDNRQELLALNIGAASWDAWKTELVLAGNCETWTVADFTSYQEEADPDTLLGNRWLTKGGSCLWFGPSGAGKSTLCMQAAVSWAAGRDFFGIRCERPLKSLVVQAENDLGDEAQMFKGVIRGLRLERDTSWHSNLVVVRNCTHTGDQFVDFLERLHAKHRPDLIWVDPLYAYLGGDVSDQGLVSRFLRNRLNAFLQASGAILFMVHHISKPPREKTPQRASLAQYAAAGSSELNNWARAVIALEPEEAEGQFQLRLVKRGKRAGMLNHYRTPCTSLPVSHSDDGQYWRRTDGDARIDAFMSQHAGALATPERWIEHLREFFPKANEQQVDGVFRAVFPLMMEQGGLLRFK